MSSLVKQSLPVDEQLTNLETDEAASFVGPQNTITQGDIIEPIYLRKRLPIVNSLNSFGKFN